ncbi:MAG: hypothetical protein ACREMF_10205 [Gemmatimonadales bacterium]
MRPRTAVLAALLAAAPALAAQRTWQWEAALVGVGMRVHSQSGTTPPQRLSGAVFGLQGQITFARRLTLDLGYVQGQLDPSSTGASVRDYVEGSAMIGARPLSWLSLRVGPHAWTYLSNAGTQRWFLWEARGQARGEILPEVHSYLELWRVLSANVNVPQPFQSGYGGEGGLILRVRDAPLIPAKFPVRLRLGYGIERIRMVSGAGIRTELIDRLTLSMGIEQR